jgi:hypothetical protein
MEPHVVEKSRRHDQRRHHQARRRQSNDTRETGTTVRAQRPKRTGAPTQVHPRDLLGNTGKIQTADNVTTTAPPSPPSIIPERGDTTTTPPRYTVPEGVAVVKPEDAAWLSPVSAHPQLCDRGPHRGPTLRPRRLGMWPSQPPRRTTTTSGAAWR